MGVVDTVLQAKKLRPNAIKTPGGRLVVQFKTKTASHPKCALTRCRLNGIPELSVVGARRLGHKKRRVNRSYGGVLTSSCLKKRILRAYLVEEYKIWKLINGP